MSNDDKTRIKYLVRSLRMTPHPEGGFYKEVYRCRNKVTIGAKLRCAATDIYFLLIRGQVSRFHRIASDEIWHFYEGGPLEMTEVAAGTLKESKTTIGNTGKVLRYKHLIKAGNWQAARPLGRYTLVGCTVAPGFEFEDFELLKNNRSMREKIVKKHPGLQKLI